VRSGVTTVSVHATASTLSPVTTNSVTKCGTTASIDSRDSGWLRAYDARGLTKNWLTCAGGGRRTSVCGRGGWSGGDRSSVLAAILASIRNETVTIGGSTVTIGRAATSISTLCITAGATEVLAASTIVPSWDDNWFRISDGLYFFTAARLAAVSAMGWGVSTPSVRAAAGSGVSGAVGIAEQVAVGRTTFAVEGVLGILPLLWETNGGSRPGDDLGVIALGVGSTSFYG
jgi:hypothetical protein